MTEDEDVLTLEETLKALDISRPTLQRWMKSGRLRPVGFNPLLGRQRPPLKFRRSDIDQLKGEAQA